MAKSRKNKRSADKRSRPSKYTAKTADRHELYQLSVQAPEHEVEFMGKAYKKARGRKALTMREDFCGTALLCAEWVKSHKERTAVGVDLDEPTLEWGRERNIAPLADEAKQRVSLLLDDVRTERQGKFDLINALNFSYWIFQERTELCSYFKKVHASLEDEGVFFCDSYGGWESQQPMLEPRKISAGFTYVWDQDSFDPITHEMINHIHFEFKDGSKMKKAFSYVWRHWSLKEIRELLLEAGFSEVQIYWDQADSDDEEKYRVTERADNQPGWLAYICALK